MKTAPRFLLIASILIFPLITTAQIYDTNNAVVQVFAGAGNGAFLDAQGTLAMFYSPNGIVADTNGNLYVWDQNNYKVRKITTNGAVSTFTSFTFGATAGGMVIDSKKTLWIIGNYGIRQVFSDGSSVYLSYSGINDSSAIAVDSSDNIYYTANNSVYQISSTGVLTQIAGNGISGNTDGNGSAASFSGLSALAVDQAGNIYAWCTGNRKIRRIDGARNVTTIAGSGNSTDVDGTGTGASFANIYSMFCDNQGNVIMACGSSIRKMNASTNVMTIAGSFSQNSYANGAGSLARFNGATGVCLSQGQYFVADSGNNRIRVISFNPQPQLVSPAYLGLNNYAGVSITGLVGRSYRIESSNDLTNWTTRATVLLNSSPYLWIDPTPVTVNNNYRAYLLP